jgi:hypothetical protein
VSRAAICALVAALLAASGCKSTSSGVNNPFLAPDRVAPPSTRVLAPGQAQPYYQGDPLPVMQSATAPPANILATSNSAADARSSTGKVLAWNAPGGAAPVAPAAHSAANAPSPWDASPTPATQVAYANEPAIAVPTDAGELRFALPAPISPESVMPIAAAAAPPAPQSVQPAAPLPNPTYAPNHGVMLASYNAPAASQLSPVASTPVLSPTPQITSPWRTPQISPPSTAPMYGMQASSYQPVITQPVNVPPPPAYVALQSPTYAPTNAVAVQLRSVPSPPPQPGNPMPRIRIPGYEAPQTASPDGFRPRSPMR